MPLLEGAGGCCDGGVIAAQAGRLCGLLVAQRGPEAAQGSIVGWRTVKTPVDVTDKKAGLSAALFP